MKRRHACIGIKNWSCDIVRLHFSRERGRLAVGYTNKRAERVEEPSPLTKHAGGGLVADGIRKGTRSEIGGHSRIPNTQHFCSRLDTDPRYPHQDRRPVYRVQYRITSPATAPESGYPGPDLRKRDRSIPLSHKSPSISFTMAPNKKRNQQAPPSPPPTVTPVQEETTADAPQPIQPIDVFYCKSQ